MNCSCEQEKEKEIKALGIKLHSYVIKFCFKILIWLFSPTTLQETFEINLRNRVK